MRGSTRAAVARPQQRSRPCERSVSVRGERTETAAYAAWLPVLPEAAVAGCAPVPVVRGTTTEPQGSTQSRSYRPKSFAPRTALSTRYEADAGEHDVRARTRRTGLPARSDVPGSHPSPSDRSEPAAPTRATPSFSTQSAGSSRYRPSTRLRRGWRNMGSVAISGLQPCDLTSMAAVSRRWRAIAYEPQSGRPVSSWERF